MRDILKPGTDEVLISKDHMMTEDDAALMESFDIHSAEIRTVLTCKAHSGICAKCYGMNLATSKPVGPGEAVGIIAAQSIGEPGTQPVSYTHLDVYKRQLWPHVPHRDP